MARTIGSIAPLKKRISIPGINAPHILGRGPRNLQVALAPATRTDMPGIVPAGMVATKPEWWCYWALEKLGKIPGVDFTFQSSLMGGRMELGGVVLDFLMQNPPNLGIAIQGVHWHYGLGGDRKAHDAMSRLQIEGKGIKLIYVDEDDVLANPIYFTTEALAGRDHSRMEGY